MNFLRLVSSYFEYPVSIGSGGRAYSLITYNLSCLINSGNLQFWVDGVIITKASCNGCGDRDRTMRISLTPGTHIIRVSYVSTFLSSSVFDCNKAIIKMIKNYGVTTNGGYSK